jgi:hypothetical protein
MDGTVLVALVALVVLGMLGVVALAKKGRVHWESNADHSIKVEVEGGERRKRSS